MSTTAVEPQSPVEVGTSVDRVGQATAIEQSRAVAEVQAAIVVAQKCPRSISDAVDMMRESCRQTALAERAFYRFPRAGGMVTGPSVHLARELARCWGNVQYGVAELRRDDEHGQSEMQAYAWDVQTNTRSIQVFVVPHKRDKRGGPERLVDMRDIYENNANNGARRLREAIFAIIPPWFVEEAKELCAAALTDGGGKPLAQRIVDSVKAFDEQFGVTVDQLEQKLGRNRDRWTDHDIAQLTVTFKSLRRGEITVDEEFAARRVTAAEITGLASPPQEDTTSGSSTSDEAEKPARTMPADMPPHDSADEDDTPRPPSEAQRKKLFAVLREHGITDTQRKAVLKGHYQVDSLNDLNSGQIAKLIDRLEADGGAEAFRQVADEWIDAQQDHDDGEEDDGADLATRARARADNPAKSLRDRIVDGLRTLAQHDQEKYQGAWGRLEKITDGRAASPDWSGASETRLRSLADDIERVVAELDLDS